MKKRYILVLTLAINTIAFAQIDAVTEVASTKIEETKEKAKDTIQQMVKEVVTEKVMTNDVAKTVSTVTNEAVVDTSAVSAAILNNKEDIHESVSHTHEEYFTFEGQNNGHLFFKKLSDGEVIIFDHFASEELKTKMLSLGKDNISDVFGVTYQPKVKELDSKQLEGDGEQVETTVTEILEMVNAVAQKKHEQE